MKSTRPALPPQFRQIDDELAAKIVEFKNHKGLGDWLEKSPSDDDWYFKRWITSTKGDVDTAVEKFVACMKWRKENGVDMILETAHKNPYFEKMLGYWPGSAHWENHPKSRDGSVVFYQAIGRCDPSMIDSVGLDNLLVWHIWVMERVEKLWRETVAELGYWPGFVIIEDLAGAGWHSFSSQVLSAGKMITGINQNYYPDMLRKLYIMNVPSIFYASWSVIQYWLEERTLVKIDLINGGMEEVGDRFDIIIDPSELPPRLGGTSDRDIPEAGDIGAPNMKLRSGVKVPWIPVGRADALKVSCDLEVGDIFSWEWKTRGYDLGFNVTLNGRDIVKSERHEAFKRVVMGYHEVVEAGTYLCTWDNTFSWTRSKEIKYNLIVKSGDSIKHINPTK